MTNKNDIPLNRNDIPFEASARDTCNAPSTSNLSANVVPRFDLFDFALLERQPISTISTILDLIANDLYRRRDYPALAGEIKKAARDLRAMTRHHETKV